MSEKKEQATLDLSQGIAASELGDGGLILGRVGDEEVVLARSGTELFAIGAHCTHYRGPLAEGLIVGDTVRCPWHHACFSLRTGEALRAPALDPIPCWRVERDGDTVFVREKLPPPTAGSRARPPASAPASVVIVGGGAAGLAAAEMLRREGYDGPLTMISADDSPPFDRPNLSKDFLAGNGAGGLDSAAAAGFYDGASHRAACSARAWRRSIRRSAARPPRRRHDASSSARCSSRPAPIRCGCRFPAPTDAQVHYLRTFADSRAIVAQAARGEARGGRGRELHRPRGRGVAAGARDRGATWSRPRARRSSGSWAPSWAGSSDRCTKSTASRSTSAQTVERVDGRAVTLSGGDPLDADFVVVGVGVQAGDRARRAGRPGRSIAASR